MTRAAAIAAEIPRLRRYARALTGDAAAADDLVQDCLVRALAKQRQWREGDSPRQWLFAILHNLFIDETRRRKRRPASVTLEAADHQQAQGGSPETAAVHDIDAAITRLPDGQREVLLLVALEGFSYAEAARMLEIPIGTVMSRIARARERLRNDLFGDSGDKTRLTRVK